MGGEASHAATCTGQTVGGQVPWSMLKRARCTKLPDLERGGSIANMRNYSLDIWEM